MGIIPSLIEASAVNGGVKVENLEISKEEQSNDFDRRRRLKGASIEQRRARVLRFLEKKVWATMPDGEQGRRLTRAEEDEMLGLGPDGV